MGENRVRSRVIGIFFVLSFLFGAPLEAGEEVQLYRKAVKAAKSDHVDFAFMYYNSILRNYPQSKYREDALFALGEYDYQLPNYAEAAQMFESFIADYPQSPGRLFALAYLYKVAEIQENQSMIDDLKKEILTFRQVGLVFKEFKEREYHSPLERIHRAVFHIDMVEFYIAGDLFAQVSYH